MPLSKRLLPGCVKRTLSCDLPSRTDRLHPLVVRAFPVLAAMSQKTGKRVRLLSLLAALACSTAPVCAQTEDPSDVSTTLSSNTNDAISPAFLASPGCAGTSNGPFSLGSVSSVSAPSDNLPYAPCAYSPSVPAPPAPAKDIWFRMDLPFADATYRFTLYGTGTPAMTKGGMAVYEAANASGPFRLLDCSLGGSFSTAALPTVEASSITAGYKIYVRVWDNNTVPINSNFTICIKGQRASTLALPAFDRGADETPCTARTIAEVIPSFSPSTAPSVINYVHASDGSGSLPTSAEKAGGDLWVKLLIPPVGHVRMKASYGTVPSSQIGAVVASKVSGSVGVSAYLASNCGDLTTFKEVSNTTELVSPIGSSTPIEVKCLPAGEWLYVRFYGLKEATSGTKVKRFGQFRFEWMPGPLPYPGWTPAARPANCDPCGALALTVDAPCTGAAVTLGSTVGACSVPGIPFPTCGGFSAATQSVWHKFVAPLSGAVVIDAKGAAPTPISPAIALYTSNDQGCGGRMALIACDDRQGPGQDARIIKFELVPGQTYYIRTWTRTTEGTFSLCVSAPTAPAGSCLYIIDLWSLTSAGALSMDVSINGGPVTTYTPSGGEMSQTFLIPIPLGATADFHVNTSSSYYFHGLWQFGQPDVLWWGDGGYAVAGPAPTPVTSYHLASACQPIVHPPSDCRGMRTICLSGAASNYPVSGVIENRPKPRHPGPSTNAGAYSDYGSTDYNGYTYNIPNGNAYDLAGANMGCLSPEQNGIEWLVFRPEADGSVGFLLNAFKGTPAPSGPVDLDFAIWDLGTMVYTGPDSINADLICPPRTAPLRCSSARFTGSTGLVAGMSGTSDGDGGWGWLKPLPVQMGHGYLIALMPVGAVGAINYTLNWTLYRNAGGTTDPSIISCDLLVLPVELLFLAAQQRENVVDLTWATASEMNSSQFIVERSTNALDFTPIGTVDASGNSQYRIDYAFTDPAPIGGVNYYRLQLVDLDGSRETSNMVAVMFNGDGSRVLAWPNPTRDQLNVGADLRGQTTVQVQVVDALGRMIQRSEVPVGKGKEHVEVDTKGLAPGSYMVHLSGSTGIPIGTAHFVKE